MKEFHISTDLPGITPRGYLQLHLDRSYNAHLDQKAGVTRVFVQETTEQRVSLDKTGETVDVYVRSSDGRPQRNIPKPLQKLVDGPLIFAEHTTFEAPCGDKPPRGRFTIKAKSPAILSKHFQGGGTVTITPQPSGGVVRRIDGHVNIPMPFGLGWAGSMAEALIVADMEKTFARLADETRAWLDEHPDQYERHEPKST